MSDFPDFSEQHYRVERELGHNRAGGRVTYLATDTRVNQPVVIKQFQFAKSGSTWSSYDTYDREIQLLKELDHPGIPRYLDSFQMPDGFCMVQEYKNAESLAASRSYHPNEIRQIAVAALEVLVYLQNRIPPVIHRDIKPENILVDKAGNVYLVDFGFARVGEGEVGVSSVVKGTLGFMPPEQLFNRQLTEASDLYGLGMSLICLLTGTKSDNIGDLVDISYRVSFKHLVPKLNQHWVNWLEKMVEPRLKDRYPNALAAIAALPTTPLRPPEAQFSQSTLVLKARKPGGFLSQSITITNPTPDTTLEGKWEIAPHRHDPPLDLYQWISVSPDVFSGNEVQCVVTVDTRRLMTGKIYIRTLLLHTNTLAKTYPLTLQIQTLPTPAQSGLLPYGLLSLLCILSLGISWLATWMVLIMGTIADSTATAGFGAVVGTAMGLQLAAWFLQSSGASTGSIASTLTAIVLGIGIFFTTLMDGLPDAGSSAISGALGGLLGGAILGTAIGAVVEKLVYKELPKGMAIAISLVTAMLGMSLGMALATSFSKSFVLILVSFSSFTLLALLLHLILKQSNNTAQRKPDRYFIKP